MKNVIFNKINLGVVFAIHVYHSILDFVLLNLTLPELCYNDFAKIGQSK